MKIIANLVSNDSNITIISEAPTAKEAIDDYKMVIKELGGVEYKLGGDTITIKLPK